jgi:hypothetical protein
VKSLLLKQKTKCKTITGKTIKRVVLPVIVLLIGSGSPRLREASEFLIYSTPSVKFAQI